jgi:hypothetical protein
LQHKKGSIPLDGMLPFLWQLKELFIAELPLTNNPSPFVLIVYGSAVCIVISFDGEEASVSLVISLHAVGGELWTSCLS